ncbi:MAG TPA: S9 family peptidase [Mycobacteriales bacterium]|nr:S9 family peptidase [Mycobacteriales bacterium]
MKPADLALLRTPGVPSLSPDGRRAAVAVTRLDLDADEYRSQLWLLDTTGGAEPRPLTHGPRDSAPRWSPDGRWLAFLRVASTDSPGPASKPQLYLLPTDGGEPRRLTEHPLGAGMPVWSPDSGRIAYSARVPEAGRYGTTEGVPPEKEAPRRITTLRFREDNIGFTLDRRPHLFVLDPFADEPAPVQVTTGDFDDRSVSWSPDGSRLAFVSARHALRDTTLFTDVFTCTPDGGDLRQITRTRFSIGGQVFSPDGGSIVFLAERLGADGRDFVGYSGAVWVVPADGSAEPRALTDPTVAVTDQGTGPVLVTDEQGTAALVLSESRGAAWLVRVPLAGEPAAVQPVVGGQRQVTGYDAAGGVVVVAAADPRTVGELVAVRAGVEQRLTSFGAELAERGEIRPLVELSATAPDGYPVHGWLVRPDGPGPHPVLLSIHGGPFRQYGWGLFDEAQVYAGGGYAVVLGNPRGSAGYGEEHARSIKHAMGTVDADDLLALLDAALAEPDLDADRVGVMGGSYGGYMTTWLAAHAGHRFKAAIPERAVTAWDSFTGSSDIGYFFTEAYAGTDAAQVAAQSPLTYADKIDIPTLIIHSEHDWRCPVEQAQRLYVALKARGVPTELLLFPGEGHEMSRSGLPSHRLARFDAILDWWSRHLGG